MGAKSDLLHQRQRTVRSMNMDQPKHLVLDIDSQIDRTDAKYILTKHVLETPATIYLGITILL